MPEIKQSIEKWDFESLEHPKKLVSKYRLKDFIDPKEFLGETFIYQGWVRNCNCSTARGVYIIVCDPFSCLKIAEKSFAGKRINKTPKDPTICDKEWLMKKWVDYAEILYIGKAEKSIDKRMKQHINFWSGNDDDRAWGGRLIAQIEGFENFEVWEMTCDKPEVMESELIDRFIKKHGKLPFANLKRGKR